MGNLEERNRSVSAAQLSIGIADISAVVPAHSLALPLPYTLAIFSIQRKLVHLCE